MQSITSYEIRMHAHQEICTCIQFHFIASKFIPNNRTSNFIQGAAKVSILMIGHQAIMDAYLCLLHLTAGILVGEHSIVLLFCG